MTGIANLAESPDEAIGCTPQRPDDYDQPMEAAESLMPRVRSPRGVVRFHPDAEASA